MVGPVVFEMVLFCPRIGPTKFCTFIVNCLKRECLSSILIANDENIYNPLQVVSSICAECPPLVMSRFHFKFNAVLPSLLHCYQMSLLYGLLMALCYRYTE